QRQRDILNVHVTDPVGEVPDELDGVHALPVQMTRVKREPELLAAVDGLDRPFGTVQVERDLPGVHLESEADAGVPAGVQDWVPTAGECAERLVDRFRGGPRVAGDGGTYRRAGKAAHHRGPPLLR